MQLVKQLPNTQTCGPAVLAMLAEVSIETAILAIGGEGYATVERMQKAARALGMTLELIGAVADETQIPEVRGGVLLKITNGKGRQFDHWIAWNGHRFFDPKFGEREKLLRSDSESLLSAEFFACDRDDSVWPAKHHK